MIGNPRSHCWRHAQRLVNASEVVVHEVKDHRGFVILNIPGNALVNRANRRIDRRMVRLDTLRFSIPDAPETDADDEVARN
jgi:hypothetical protein